MDALTLLIVAVVVSLYLWIISSGRKLKARIARIRRIHWPDAKICYMDLRGRRGTWQITIESIRPRGKDWLIVAWCHEKKGFFTYNASRIYEYVDLNHVQEVKNIPDYFSHRFMSSSANRNPKAAGRKAAI